MEKSALAQSKRLEEMSLAEMDALWDEGKIDTNTIEQWGKEHLRTPYK